MQIGNLEIYNHYVLYMSGRSGYGRSRIVGKIIHKPANMMIAGLAPIGSFAIADTTGLPSLELLA